MAEGKQTPKQWSCGNTTSIPEGARFFFHRQGEPPRGIIGSGWVTEETYRDAHWDEERAGRGDEANYVKILFDSLIKPDEDPLEVEKLPHAELQEVYWHTPASGISIPDEAALVLEELWGDHHSTAFEEPDRSLGRVEGDRRIHLVQHRSRERILRVEKLNEAKRQGTLPCEVPGCGFDFEEMYGELGTDYAQVHHLIPLSQLSQPTRVTLDDLAIVCANCHVMIHRGGKCRDLDELIPTV